MIARDGLGSCGQLPKWGVVLAAKTLDISKSRLRGLGLAQAVVLAAAMFEDTLSAVVHSEAVGPMVIVTSDSTLGGVAQGAGATVIPDPGLGLNGAFLAGWDRLRSHAQGVVFLPGDLPCLTSSLLGQCLEQIAPSTAVVVPDCQYSGTTMLVSDVGNAVMPRFGPGSLAAHREQGAKVRFAEHDALRRDVDTPQDLLLALRIGVGPCTTRECERLGLLPGRLLPA